MIVAGHSEGLLGYTFYNRKVEVIDKPEEHPAFSQKLDTCHSQVPMSLLVVALRDHHGNTTALVQIFRARTELFGCQPSENAFLNHFCMKFSSLYPLITNSVVSIDKEIANMLQYMEIEHFLLVFQKQMEVLFHCDRAEIWRHDRTERKLYVYRKTKIKAEMSKAGIVGEAIHRLCPISCVSNRMMSSYHVEADGRNTEPVLCVPISNIRTNVTTAVVLRGGVPVFTHHDQKLLTRVAQFVVLALNNLEAASNPVSIETGETSERKCLEILTKIVDRIQMKTEMKEIIVDVVENMEILTRADHSSIFTFNHQTAQLNTIFSTGKNYPKVIQSQVIPARAYSFGKIINLADAYESREFDAAIDLETGYQTRSVLAMPMMNGQSESIGSIEFLNRSDGKPFRNADVRFLQIILTVLGMVIDTDRLKQDVVKSTKELRSFLALGMSLFSDNAMQGLLSDIMGNLRRKMAAKAIAIYLTTIDNVKMRLFLFDGIRLQSFLPLSHGIGSIAVKSKETIITHNAIADPRFVRDPLDDSGVTIQTMICVPIINSTGHVFGVAEIANKNDPFTDDDIRVMKSFGELITLCLDRRNMEEISDHGNVEFEMD
jgi:GAF domain-containing protein